jgi:hypothetical protein
VIPKDTSECSLLAFIRITTPRHGILQYNTTTSQFHQTHTMDFFESLGKQLSEVSAREPGQARPNKRLAKTRLIHTCCCCCLQVTMYDVKSTFEKVSLMMLGRCWWWWVRWLTHWFVRALACPPAGQSDGAQLHRDGGQGP